MSLSLILRLVVLGMIWGGSFLFMRIAVPVFGTGFTAAGRLALAAVALLAFAAMQGARLNFRANWKAYLWIGAISASIPFVLFAFTARYLPAGYSAVLNATVPLFAVLLGWYLHKQRPSVSKFVGVVVGLAGVATIARFGTVTLTALTFLSFAAGLGAAILYAIGAAEVRRLFATTDPVVVATGSQVGAAVLLLPLFVVDMPTAVPALAPALALIALGLVCTAVAFVMYFRILREAGPERGTTVTFMVPVFAQIWGALFLHEAVTWAIVIGLGLVLFAVALVFEKVKLPRRKSAVVLQAAMAPCAEK